MTEEISVEDRIQPDHPLREKFAGVAPFEIVTVRGIGYRLDRKPSADGTT